MSHFRSFIKEFLLVLLLVLAVNFLLSFALAPMFDGPETALSMRPIVLKNFLLTALTMLSAVPAGYLVFQNSKDIKMSFTIPALASGLAMVLLSFYGAAANIGMLSSFSHGLQGVFLDYFFSAAALAISYFCLGLVGGLLGGEIRYKLQRKKSPKSAAAGQ